MEEGATRFDLNLLEHEEIIYESLAVLMTNQRLLANWSKGAQGSPRDIVFLRDVYRCDKLNGGRLGRMWLGTRLLALGCIAVVLQIVTHSILQVLGETLEVLLFLLTSGVLVVGIYLIAGSLLHRKPHTTVIFERSVGINKDIYISFPGWDNPEAEELIRCFTKTKRGF